MTLAALILSSATALGAAPDVRPGWPAADVLFDCNLRRASDSPAPKDTPGEASVAVLFAGSSGGSAEPRPSVETHDPDLLMSLGGAYSVLHAWPQRMQVGFPQDMGPGIHGEVLPARHFGGTFTTVRIDRRAHTAHVVLLQYGSFSEPHRPANVRVRYMSQCRLFEGAEADTLFRTIQE